jgi:IrrE N-terminal-like domain
MQSELLFLEDQAEALEATESLHALDELFRLAGQFSTRAAYRDLLRFIARFRMYSPFNAMLVYTQMLGATYVATARRWLQDYMRRIHPGARPITILQPKGPVMFVFDVSDTIPLPGAPELPQSVTDPFAIFRGKENGELAKTIQNAKRDGIRVHEREFGSQYAGRIQTANTRDVFVLPVGPSSSEKQVSVPVRYELLLNSRQTAEERYATLAHELGHLYCGHLGPWGAQHWPDRRYLGPQIEECEAESVSYLACERMGIESPSAEYIAQYLVGSGKMPEISVDTVLKAAGVLWQMGRTKLPLRKAPKEN